MSIIANSLCLVKPYDTGVLQASYVSEGMAAAWEVRVRTWRERDGLYTFTVPCKWVGRHYRYFSLSIDIPFEIIVGGYSKV